MIVNHNSTNIKEIWGYKVVQKVAYLGSLIAIKGCCDEEIKHKLTVAL